MLINSALYFIFLTYFAESFLLFPALEPELYDDPLVTQGPYEVIEYRVELPIAADGSPSGITVFKPEGIRPWSRLPTVLWTMGSNVQAHYQQELHQTLASYGYAVVIPDTRPLTFIPDLNYHGRNVALGQQALRLAKLGFLGFRVDRNSIAVGGYSIGGSLATFIAAEEEDVDAIFMWGPSPSPFWFGVEPEELWPEVTQPAFFLLAENDDSSPPGGYPLELKNSIDTDPEDIAEYIIPNGTHLFFQQPTGADGQLEEDAVNNDNWTREEQQVEAINRTLDFLTRTFGVVR